VDPEEEAMTCADCTWFAKCDGYLKVTALCDHLGEMIPGWMDDLRDDIPRHCKQFRKKGPPNEKGRG
jgi:hypothetical protein